MSRHLTRGMVVLADDHPGSRAALTVALEYSPRTVVVADRGVETPAGAEVVHPRHVDIDQAFRCAGAEQIPWITLRRDFAGPDATLREVLEATGRRARKDLPGFAVMFTGPEPRTVTRILAVVDRADGQPSGLLVLASVAAAQATGAHLDVLLLGAPGESVSTPASVDEALDVTRDGDLYDQALRRARESGLAVDWLAAEDVADKPSLVLEQIAEGDYDLVIEDLGSVKLGGRLGRGGRIRRAVDPDGPAAIVRAVLDRTEVPLVIVLDGVRMGLIPPAAVRGGAGAALALGIITSAAPVASASPSELADQQAAVSQAVDAYADALAQAADLASPTEVRAALDSGRTEPTGEQATGGQATGGPVAQAADMEASGASEASTTATAPEADADATKAQEAAPEAAEPGGDSSPDAHPDDAEDGQEGAASSVAPADLAPEDVVPEKAPKVDAADVEVDEDVTQEAVDKAQRAEQEAEDDLTSATKEFATSQEAAVEATERTQEAAQSAGEAAADLAEADAAYQEATTHTAAVVEEATGLSGALPGAADGEALAAAEAEQAAEAAQLKAVATQADQALEDYEQATQEAARADEKLREAADDVTEADAQHKEAAANAEATQAAYDQAVADARVSPCPGYAVTTHHGQTGPMWSTGSHTGIDYAAPEGTAVVAAASGTVVEVSSGGAYGNRVVVEHDDGYLTTYSHLSAVDAAVGQEVSAGDRIGAVGSTGNSTGAHLHFEVAQGGDGWASGSFVDPEVWLQGA